MRKLDLSKLAAISEIVATVAVVISLLFVGYSIKRNTDELHSSNTNFLYELDAQITADLSREPGLSSILVKVAQNDALSEIEKIQYVNLQHRFLTVWEIAWTQHNSGLLDFDEWTDWDRYLSGSVTRDFPQDWWIDIRSGYKPRFAHHVDAAYADN
jgi:hypothetical protein